MLAIGSERGRRSRKRFKDQEKQPKNLSVVARPAKIEQRARELPATPFQQARHNRLLQALVVHFLLPLGPAGPLPKTKVLPRVVRQHPARRAPVELDHRRLDLVRRRRGDLADARAGRLGRADVWRAEEERGGEVACGAAGAEEREGVRFGVDVLDLQG